MGNFFSFLTSGFRQHPSRPATAGSRSTSRSRSLDDPKEAKRKSSAKQRYALIPDRFLSLDQVTTALREAGLESSNLILGIDFTKSNEWTGKVSFNNRSLHRIGDVPNPYETAISIIGKTLAPLDEDNLIPCFGFGDVTTHDREVFSFHGDHSPCHGFEEVLACYRRIVPSLKLSGPTSYGPIVEAAVDIVEKSGGQFHVLVIIADGQVTRSVDTSDEELSPQEERTIGSIVEARKGNIPNFPFGRGGDFCKICAQFYKFCSCLYPLSIVLVGVGDGPWEDMQKFDDKIPQRDFDNFQFVNFTAIMSKSGSPSEREAAFALAALMEIPFQYKATIELGLLGHARGKAKRVFPRPPPPGVPHQDGAIRMPTNLSASANDQQNQECPVCLTNPKNMAFGCGHMTCRECERRLSSCPVCRQPITSRLRLYT